MYEDSTYLLRFVGTSPEDLPAPDMLELIKSFLAMTDNPEDLRLVGIVNRSYGAQIKAVDQYEHDFTTEMSDAQNDNISPAKAKKKNAFIKLAASKGVFAELYSPDSHMIAKFSGKVKIADREDLSASGFKEAYSADVKIMKVQTKKPGSKVTQIGLLQMGEKRQLPRAFADHELGAELAKHYREEVTVFGEAYWQRFENGEWAISSFHLESFEPIRKSNIWDIFEKIDALAGEWPDDTSKRLDEIRRGPK